MTAPARRDGLIEGMRGVAVLAVVADHYRFCALWGGHQFGLLAVKFFFLLTGFFVTASFLKNPGRSVAEFQWKRFSKLGPMLWLVVLAAALLGLEGSCVDWLWIAGFGSNVLMILRDDWAGSFSHFWSLSMQVQFYLLWPLALAAVPRRWAAWVAVAGLCAGPVFRGWCLAQGVPDMLRWFHLAGSADAFAAGGLIAWFRAERPASLCAVARMPRCAFAAAVALGAVSIWMRHWTSLAPGMALLETVEIAALGLVLVLALSGVLPGRRWVDVRPLRWLGGLAFALYAIHPPLIEVCGLVLPSLGIPEAIKASPWMGVAMVPFALLAAVALNFVAMPFSRKIEAWGFAFAAAARGWERSFPASGGALFGAVAAVWLLVPLAASNNAPGDPILGEPAAMAIGQDLLLEDPESAWPTLEMEPVDAVETVDAGEFEI